MYSFKIPTIYFQISSQNTKKHKTHQSNGYSKISFWVNNIFLLQDGKRKLSWKIWLELKFIPNKEKKILTQNKFKLHKHISNIEKTNEKSII